MSYANVGKVWTAETFADYLKTVTKPKWCKFITLHHCASPSLAQRPTGFTIQHIVNIQNYYKNKLGWNRGPHLFIDEDQIFGMTPLTVAGIHAKSFNSTSIGIEVLGDYDEEDPLSGRGLACWQTTAIATKALLDWLGLDVSTSTIKFHRDDPKTSKTCPGTKVKKEWIIDMIKNAGSVAPSQPPVTIVTGDVKPVVQYVVDKTGRDFKDVAKLLKKENKLFLLNGMWLEGAYYDAVQQQTVAPVSEIDDAIATLK